MDQNNAPRLTQIFSDHSFEDQGLGDQGLGDQGLGDQAPSQVSGDVQATRLPETDFDFSEFVQSLRKSQTFWPAAFGLGLVLGCIFLVLTSWAHNTGRFQLWSMQAQDAALSTTAFFGLRVQDVEIEGALRSSTDGLEDILAVYQDKPILAATPQVIQSHVETLPWVKTARVERALPNKLILTMEEKKPAAIWQHDEQFTLIDRNGDTIDGASVRNFSNLPIMVGAQVPNKVEEFLTFIEQEQSLKPHIKAAVLVSGRRWDLQLGDAIRVKLPENNISRALADLASVTQSYDLMKRDVTIIDMRVEDRMILRLGQSTGSSVPLNSEGNAA